MSGLEGTPLEKHSLIDKIKLRLGELFLFAAMKLLPRPFWEEFAIQMYGEIKGGSAKDEANQRHEELKRRLSEYLAGRGSAEWPPKAHGK